MKTREQLIAEIMKDLDCTREEAEEVAEMEIKGAGMRHTEKSAEPKKHKPATRKSDEKKKEIIKILEKALTESGFECTIKNEEREITFEDFSVTLIKHRK